MKEVGLYQAKTQLSALVAEVAVTGDGIAQTPVREQVVDTNVLLYFFQGHSRLPKRVARLIEDSSRRSVVSMASLWEISIKASLGKLNFPPADDPDLPALLCAEGLRCATHLLVCDPARQPISVAQSRSVRPLHRR